MGKISQFHVVLNSPQAVYFAGQWIQGQVILNLNEEMKMKGDYQIIILIFFIPSGFAALFNRLCFYIPEIKKRTVLVNITHHRFELIIPISRVQCPCLLVNGEYCQSWLGNTTDSFEPVAWGL